MKSLLFLSIFLLNSGSFAKEGMKRFPANLPESMNCSQNRAISLLAETIEDLVTQKTITQARYQKFWDEVPKQNSCEEIVVLGIQTIRDCTDKQLRKSNCLK